MPIDPDLIALMVQTIMIANPPYNATPSPSTPLDVYGRHNPGDGSVDAWASPIPYKCRLEFQTKIFTDEEGRERQSSGRAYLTGFHPEVTTESQVTIPGQIQLALKNPVIMYIDNNYDEVGPYSTTLHFE